MKAITYINPGRVKAFNIIPIRVYAGSTSLEKLIEGLY